MTQLNVHVESGFLKHLGLRLVGWDENQAVLELEIGPQHLNLAGVLHGGVLTSMLDIVCGFAGCYCPVPGHVRRAVTLSLTTSFSSQAKGGLVRAVGRRRAGGRKIFVATAEVTDASGALLALGEGTYRYRSGSENPDGKPSLPLEMAPEGQEVMGEFMVFRR
jgi:uncharacterized protein (TIGR00369 family)